MKYSANNSMIDSLVRIRTIFSRHRSEVEKILAAYRENIALYGANYAPDYASEKKREALQEARGRINQADREMHEAIKELVKGIRRDFAGNLTIEPTMHFSKCMDIYDKYALKMTETEIRAFAEATSESYLGLRVLQKIAAKSGFKVNVPGAAEIESDLARIEKATRVPTMYAPTEYYTEASEVFGEKPWFRDDGSVYQRSGKVDARYLSIVETARMRMEAALDGDMKTRWNGLRSVNIEKLAESDSSEEQAAEKAAQAVARKDFADNLEIDKEADLNGAAMIAENAASELRAKDVRAHYMNR